MAAELYAFGRLEAHFGRAIKTTGVQYVGVCQGPHRDSEHGCVKAEEMITDAYPVSCFSYKNKDFGLPLASLWYSSREWRNRMFWAMALETPSD